LPFPFGVACLTCFTCFGVGVRASTVLLRAALARAGAVDLAGADGVFLCGPGDMIDDVAAMLQEQGIPQERIHFERFFQAGDVPRAPRSAAAEAAAAHGVTVEVVLDGTRRQFTVEAGDDNVVDAAERQGLELPYSCKGGMCGTCRCKVAEGSAEMAVNYSLEPWELEAGFTLACQARPTSDRLVLCLKPVEVGFHDVLSRFVNHQFTSTVACCAMYSSGVGTDTPDA
jgi:ferredoxin